MSVMIDYQELIQSAELATGYRGLVDDALSARVRQLIQAIDPDYRLTAEETKLARAQLLRMLVTRVQLEADRRRIPEIEQEIIERPVFVVGYMRTGTSILQALLAEDPASQAPCWWHVRQPSPPPGEGPIAPGRLMLAQRELEQFVACAPNFLALHPYWDKGNTALIEDEEIYTLDFQNAYPSLLYQVATLPVLGAPDNPAEAYRFQKKFLQHLQWRQPRKRWVLKGTLHQFTLSALFEEFPDALCLWPHRDPAEVQASALAIISVLWNGINHGRTDWAKFAQSFVEGVRLGTDQILNDPLVDDPRVVHIRFKDVARDPVSMVRKLYDQAGFEYCEAYDSRMKNWLSDPDNRSDRHGRYPYSLEAFGLRTEAVRERFSDYSRRFGLD